MDSDGNLLGDVSALAHADLAKLLDADAPSAEVTRVQLVDDLKQQLDDGSSRAARDPFRAGAVYTDFDSVPHAFGLAATAQLHHRVTGDSHYDAFATQQRNWTLGANAWGSPFVIGAGSTFPHCPGHQPANLASDLDGDLDGEGDILRGGVVNGPNAADKLKDLNSFPTMRKCPTGQGNPSAAFDGHGGGYMDHGAWQTVESAAVRPGRSTSRWPPETVGTAIAAAHPRHHEEQNAHRAAEPEPVLRGAVRPCRGPKGPLS
ncbi:glycoside hydrolase family 9 protein [Streptomyces sirii]|uniref:glycoside hydrolase family 9 protein n=1 Tax=Streptomyces sirii TaxID=3127701 RepID=UPI003D366228